MRTLRSTAPICGLLLLLSEPAFAQSKSQKIDALVKPFATANQFSGVVLAAEDGKVIYEKAFGVANADYKIPNQVNTRIGIASITKLFTSVILTRLVEQKKIATADKLAKYHSRFSQRRQDHDRDAGAASFRHSPSRDAAGNGIGGL
jgi:CubicO group peptidase (beta-lactamase class C family)